jgi:hypothetical protein
MSTNGCGIIVGGCIIVGCGIIVGGGCIIGCGFVLHAGVGIGCGIGSACRSQPADDAA